MSEFYKVNNAEEALALAMQFKEQGKYDLFRGQVQNWPVVCSLNRLSTKKRNAEIEKLIRFRYFLSQIETTRKYANNENWYFAVAQHYGLGTSFIDFTQNPQIALFFATNSRKNFTPKECVIICLNSRDFTETVDMFSNVFTKSNINLPQIIDIDVENLWRLELQEGCFLDCSIQNFEEVFYPFDRIAFPFEEPFNSIVSDIIYPKSKSELEILLDQYFAGEHLIEKERRFKKFIEEFPQMKVTKTLADPVYKYVKTKKQHKTWRYDLIKKWNYKAIAKYEETIYVLFVIDKIIPMNDINAANDIIYKVVHNEFKTKGVDRARTIEARIEFKKQNNKYINKIVCQNVSDIWDGMRKLPYTNEQIIKAVSKYIFLEINGLKKAEEYIYPNSIYITMSSKYGIHNRCYVSEYKIKNAFREDILDILIDSLPNSISSRILLFIYKPRVVFDFEKLTNLFADEIIPSQMFMQSGNKKPIVFYSPVHINILGYA